MDFFSLLLTCIAIWILVKVLISPIVRVGFTVHRMRRQAREAFEAFNNAAQGYPGQQQQQPQHNHGKKKIDKNVGEYIEFEEISSSQTVSDNTGNTSTRTVTEAQVTDAEWEDIK